MGNKRVGLARTQALLENMKREIVWGEGGIMSQQVVLLGDENTTLTAGAHAGRTLIIPNVSGNRTYTLPTPEEGMHIHLVGFGALAADGHNVLIRSSTDSIFFHGALLHHDTNQGAQTSAIVWGDGTSNDLITMATPEAFDIHLVGKSSTVWYMYGWSSSVTVVAVANG